MKIMAEPERHLPHCEKWGGGDRHEADCNCPADGGSYIVTVTPTIMDGWVVRWHTSLEAAEKVKPIVSASRNMVAIHTVNSDIAYPDAFAAANKAHEGLRTLYPGADLPNDIRKLATHKPAYFMGPLEEIKNNGDSNDIVKR